MSPNVIYPVILFIVFSGALFGMLIGRLLPPQNAPAKQRLGFPFRRRLWAPYRHWCSVS